MTDLKIDATKIRVIDLYENGHAYSEISNLTGIPASTVGDFLNKRTYSSWWNSYSPNGNTVHKPPTMLKDYDKLITEFKYPIVTSNKFIDNCKHFFIPDTQYKDGIPTGYLTRVGKYIVDKRPDVIIHIDLSNTTL